MIKPYEPDFVVYNASKAKVENYKEMGMNSETAAAFNITSREQVIINTWYGGEMKKGIFFYEGRKMEYDKTMPTNCF